MALGEDRAFIASLRRVDAAIRHAPEVRVTVSGRIEGRARGGMADTMRRRIVRQDEWIDDHLEPAVDNLRRAVLRARFSVAWEQAICPATLARHLRVPLARLSDSLAQAFLGAAWSTVEALSPVLRRRPVRRTDLAWETDAADAILARLRVAADSNPGASSEASFRTELDAR